MNISANFRLLRVVLSRACMTSSTSCFCAGGRGIRDIALGKEHNCKCSSK